MWRAGVRTRYARYAGGSGSRGSSGARGVFLSLLHAVALLSLLEVTSSGRLPQTFSSPFGSSEEFSAEDQIEAPPTWTQDQVRDYDYDADLGSDIESRACGGGVPSPDLNPIRRMSRQPKPVSVPDDFDDGLVELEEDLLGPVLDMFSGPRHKTTNSLSIFDLATSLLQAVGQNKEDDLKRAKMKPEEKEQMFGRPRRAQKSEPPQKSKPEDMKPPKPTLLDITKSLLRMVKSAKRSEVMAAKKKAALKKAQEEIEREYAQNVIVSDDSEPSNSFVSLKDADSSLYKNPRKSNSKHTGKTYSDKTKAPREDSGRTGPNYAPYSIPKPMSKKMPKKFNGDPEMALTGSIAKPTDGNAKPRKTDYAAIKTKQKTANKVSDFGDVAERAGNILRGIKDVQCVIPLEITAEQRKPGKDVTDGTMTVETTANEAKSEDYASQREVLAPTEDQEISSPKVTGRLKGWKKRMRKSGGDMEPSTTQNPAEAMTQISSMDTESTVSPMSTNVNGDVTDQATTIFNEDTANQGTAILNGDTADQGTAILNEDTADQGAAILNEDTAEQDTAMSNEVENKDAEDHIAERIPEAEDRDLAQSDPTVISHDGDEALNTDQEILSVPIPQDLEEVVFTDPSSFESADVNIVSEDPVIITLVDEANSPEASGFDENISVALPEDVAVGIAEGIDAVGGEDFEVQDSALIAAEDPLMNESEFNDLPVNESPMEKWERRLHLRSGGARPFRKIFPRYRSILGGEGYDVAQ